MNLNETILFLVALPVTVVACLYLFLPQWSLRLQRTLNQPWGERMIAALRLGVPGEQQLENRMNRTVAGRAIVWDAWTERNPRATGFILLVIASAFWAALIL
ncbi:MAG: hypothetical protein OEZ10_02820 [Gammaproteobacteria bacterium]|nr:hypothetical protein [Gammaproteobacteria bacterium]